MNVYDERRREWRTSDWKGACANRARYPNGEWYCDTSWGNRGQWAVKNTPDTVQIDTVYIWVYFHNQTWSHCPPAGVGFDGRMGLDEG